MCTRNLFALASALVFCLSGCPSAQTGTTPCMVEADCASGQHCARTCPDSGADCAGTCVATDAGIVGDSGNVDANRSDSGGTDAGCTSAASCDDHDLCTTDTCTTGVCSHAPACPTGATCAPTTGMCVCPPAMADVDLDGFDSMACGGQDCDDHDAHRYPTNAEVCDPSGHDEDCDDTTVGPDANLDGYQRTMCCNIRADGSGIRCGDDCNDDSGDVRPSAPESCNMVDDNCDGHVDEGVLSSFYFDGDHDGYGTIADTVTACVAPTGYVAVSGDCNDMATGAAIHPGATEICDLVDNNCDGMTDTDMGLVCNCHLGETRLCGQPDGAGGFLNRGICRIGMQTCVDGAWSAGCTGGVFATGPTETACNGQDDNCDGSTDEGLVIACNPDGDNDRRRASGSVANLCPQGGRSDYGNCPTGYVAPGASLGDDCNDGSAAAYVNVSVRTDSDGDHYCVGGVATQCTGGAANPGSTLAGSCNGSDDCNDGNSGAFVYVTVRNDHDNDNYCAGGPYSVCTAGAPVAFTRNAGSCFGDDNYDFNYCAHDTSTVPIMHCGSTSYGCPGPGVSCTLGCPAGWDAVSCSYTRSGTQAGACSTSVSGTSCTLTQTCNVFDSSNCRMNLDCEPVPAYGGPC